MDISLLKVVTDAKIPLSNTLGAHTDIFKIDKKKLFDGLQAYFKKHGLEFDPKKGEEVSEEISQKVLLKKGKIKFFTMPLTRKKNNSIPRYLMSHAFGPFGYNLAPTYNKVMLDSFEAVRQIPYFGYGDASNFLLPDLLSKLTFKDTNEIKIFLNIVLNYSKLKYSIFHFLSKDPYFKAEVNNFEDLYQFQSFIRKNPFSHELTEKLIEFFESPITVGIRDTLRYLKGSRHPQIKFEKALKIIKYCFKKWGKENFLLPEVNYYSYDTDYSIDEITKITENNRKVASFLAAQLKTKLPHDFFSGLPDSAIEKIAYQILEFHHDYPEFEIEPYTGVISTSTMKMLLRIVFNFVVLMLKAEIPEKRNINFAKPPQYLVLYKKFVDSLTNDKLERFLDVLSEIFIKYILFDGFKTGSSRLKFVRIPKTFYNFQQYATYSPTGEKPDVVFSMEDYWQNKKFQNVSPELAEKLVVFYTLVYRFFLDTGFIPDLRPKNAGRDIFIYGIWGYMTENLLVIVRNEKIDIKFIDNRDNFKKYDPAIDVRKPVGIAKHGWRLAYPLIEPAFQRSIGIFVNKVFKEKLKESGIKKESLLSKYYSALEKGVEISRKIVNDAIDYTFTNTKSLAFDLVNDIFKGIKKGIRVAKKLFP